MKTKHMRTSETKRTDLANARSEDTAKKNLERYALLVWRIHSRRMQDIDRKRGDR